MSLWKSGSRVLALRSSLRRRNSRSEAVTVLVHGNVLIAETSYEFQRVHA